MPARWLLPLAQLRRRGPAMLLTLLLLLAAAGASVFWQRPAEPDDFYSVPEDLADHPPGALLRSEPFDGAAPAGSSAWRILYRSVGREGTPVAVSGLLFVPDDGADEPRPLIAAAHGSTGVDESCAPSLLARPTASLPAVPQALESGFAVVATDYPGLGTPGPHPYLIGDATARAVLDSLRAAEPLVDVDPDRQAIWGFSQGGHAALFAGQLAADYAPELELAGIAALAPPTDLEATVSGAEGSVVGTLTAVNTAVSWSSLDPDLQLADVVEEDSMTTAEELAQRCLDPSSLPVATWRSIQLRDAVTSLEDTLETPWASQLRANSPSGPIGPPLLVLQGEADPFVDHTVTTAYVEQRCAAGDQVAYRTYPLAEHFTLDWWASGDLVDWTTQRFEGEPATSTC